MTVKVIHKVKGKSYEYTDHQAAENACKSAVEASKGVLHYDRTARDEFVIDKRPVEVTDGRQAGG